MRLRHALVAAAMALGLDCAPGPTEIVVRVFSDLTPGSELRAVTITAVREGASGGLSRRFALDAAGVTMPGELAITSADPGDTRALRVTVTTESINPSLLGTITQEARVRFQSGKVLVLNMVLARRCAEAECGVSDTCGWSGCEAVAREGLPEYGTPTAGVTPCLQCGERCVDPQTDLVNCGGCGQRCPSNRRCVSGSCGCDGIVCGGDCVDPNTEGTHCGSCDRRCEVACSGQQCVGVDDLSAGGDTACAALSDGTVACWGDNDWGQAGAGDPVQVRPRQLMGAPSEPFAELAVGHTHTCGRTRGDTVYCWGNGSTGALGTAFVKGPGATPRSAAMGQQVSSGRGFACAVRAGVVSCWGANDYGIVDSIASAGARPLRAVPIPDPSAIRQVAAGGRHACALANSGTVWCWGDNLQRQCGQLDSPLVALPTAVDLPAAAREIAVGPSHTCALVGVGVYCWGDNRTGQLGRSTPGYSAHPEPVEMLAALHLAAGGFVGDGMHDDRGNTCAITTTGALVCWGNNHEHQLARADADFVSAPVAVPDLNGLPIDNLRDPFIQAAVGASFICARTTRHAVYCWGANDHAQLGVGVASPSPARFGPVHW